MRGRSDNFEVGWPQTHTPSVGASSRPADRAETICPNPRAAMATNSPLLTARSMPLTSVCETAPQSAVQPTAAMQSLTMPPDDFDGWTRVAVRWEEGRARAAEQRIPPATSHCRIIDRDRDVGSGPRVVDLDLRPAITKRIADGQPAIIPTRPIMAASMMKMHAPTFRACRAIS